jgi:hypothetical protein
MRRVERQFHATDSEMLEWAVRWATDNDWNVVVERFFPSYRAVACPPEELQAVVPSIGDIRRVSVGSREPTLDIATTHKLVEANPDRLWMLLGGLSDEGLREASIAGGTEDPQTVRTWRRLLRSANAEMHAGARLHGPTGESAAAPSHRHTIGAHRLAQSGVTMLAGAGSVRYEFDDLASPS